jgi:hypothetical protein
MQPGEHLRRIWQRLRRLVIECGSQGLAIQGIYRWRWRARETHKALWRM